MKILVSAIEHSANIHLKALKKELGSDAEFIGVFDKSLGNPLYDLSSFAIMGFVDAIKKIWFFLKLKDEMLDLVKDVDQVLLIDSSAFNLPLAKKIKQRYPDKKIVYYILPQAWAWKKRRIKVLEKTITHLASILPFEKDFYSKNAPIRYVGHPLLDEIKDFKQELSNNNTIAFLPGSRKSEIQALMPIYKDLATIFDKNTKKLLAIPKNFSKDQIESYYGDISDFETSHNSHETLIKCDFAYICSGTATLEAALIGTPFVLSYKAKKIDFFIAKKLVKIEHIGLANIMFKMMGKDLIHPEVLQDEVEAQRLYDEYKSMDKELFFENSKLLKEYLQGGSSKNVAKLLKI
jgi:lipid-A-disaccharide synthase